jgi:uncharacterized protein (DUF3820 family)
MLDIAEIFEGPPLRALDDGLVDGPLEPPRARPAATPPGLQVPVDGPSEETDFRIDGQRWTWLESMPPEFQWPDDPEQVEADEFYWDQLTRVDCEYLTGPRRWPEPCTSCGGRLNHSGACEEQILSMKVPFGKHAGKTVLEAPQDHVLWLLKLKNLPDDVRQAIQLRFEKEADHGS